MDLLPDKKERGWYSPVDWHKEKHQRLATGKVSKEPAFGEACPPGLSWEEGASSSQGGTPQGKTCPKTLRHGERWKDSESTTWGITFSRNGLLGMEWSHTTVWL